MKNFFNNNKFRNLMKNDKPYSWWCKSSNYEEFKDMSIQQKTYFVVILILGFSIIIFLLISEKYNCEWMSNFYYAFKYFSIPVCIFCLLIVLKFKFFKKDLLANIGFAFGFAAWIVITIATYLPILNATIGPQEKEIIDGQIINKSVTSGRGGPGYSVQIYSNKLGREMKFLINKNEYDNIEIDKHFKVDLYKGYFGLYYTNKERRLFSK